MQVIRKILLLISFLSSASLYGQTLVSLELKDADINQFVTEIEAKNDVRFFYSSADVDSIRVTVTARSEPLEVLLKRVFLNTKIKFAIDQNRNIFLTRDQPITATLPYGLFLSEKDS